MTNNEAREKAWLEYRKGKLLSESYRELFDAGWDAARTYTNEDVEMTARALFSSLEDGNADWYPHLWAAALGEKYRFAARAALGAVGTVVDD